MQADENNTTEKSRRKPRSTQGKKRPDEVCRRISEALLRANLGQNRSEAWRRRQSLARKGTHLSPETRAKIAASNTGRKFSAETRKKIGDSLRGKKQSPEHVKKLSEMRKGRELPAAARQRLSEHWKGREFSEETRRKISEAKSGTACQWWKGGVTAKNLPLYASYAARIAFVEEVKKIILDGLEILQVRCTYCGKWIIPSIKNVRSRLNCLEGNGHGESRFYCPGPSCRRQCSIFGRVKYPRDYAPGTSREVGPELRKMVLERDDYKCQKCGATEKLHCHHIDPVISNPIESADMDNCITYCKDCHKAAHGQSGCKNNELNKCRKTVAA